MSRQNTQLLYSVNTKLAYYINESFYDQHYVWCSPVFDTARLDEYSLFKKIPPSSNPFTIYQRFKQDVDNCDLHSPHIANNKSGLKKGVINMFDTGTIDGIEFARINKIIDSASIDMFNPLVFVIPRISVESRVRLVDVAEAANPLSVEYQIPDLKRCEFEIMQF